MRLYAEIENGDVEPIVVNTNLVGQTVEIA